MFEGYLPYIHPFSVRLPRLENQGGTWYLHYHEIKNKDTDTTEESLVLDCATDVVAELAHCIEHDAQHYQKLQADRELKRKALAALRDDFLVLFDDVGSTHKSMGRLFDLAADVHPEAVIELVSKNTIHRNVPSQSDNPYGL